MKKRRKFNFKYLLMLGLVALFLSIGTGAFAAGLSESDIKAQGNWISASQNGYDILRVSTGQFYQGSPSSYWVSTATTQRYYRVSGSTDWLSDPDVAAGSVVLNTGDSSIQNIVHSSSIYSDSSLNTVAFAQNAVAPDTTAPVDVSNVIGTNVSDTGLSLSWSASVSTDVSAYQIYKGLELLGSTASTSYDVSGLTPSTAYDFTIKAVDGSNNISNGVTVHYSTVAAPVPPDNSGGGDIMTGLFPSLEATGITTQATTWANNFDGLLLVVVGVGLGFAAVRFVKSLFF